MDLIGFVPDVTGKVMEEFRIEGLVQEGVTASRCHIAYWRIADQWWQAFADGPTLFIRQYDKEPSSWDAGPEFSYPVEAILQPCWGKPLSSLEIGVVNALPSLKWVFLEGTYIEASGSDGLYWTSVIFQASSETIAL